MKIGIIGAGRMAQAVGLLAVKAGHQIMLSNSRGPETIRHIGQQIGCEVGTVDDVAAFGEMVVAAIHLQMSAAIPAAPLKGKVVLNPQNYFPYFGPVPELDSGELTTAEVLARRPDGVLLSNGPADPAAVTYAIESARALLGRVPLMGICLGHQILGWACGGRTYRLKFGHHGINHPVMNLSDGTVANTSQNHNFAVDAESLDRGAIEVTHLNLNDRTVEGLRHQREPMFSIQYHPEAGPGPHDPFPLFRRFRELIQRA